MLLAEWRWRPDTYGSNWAKGRGIPVAEYRPKWRVDGRYNHIAGLDRNRLMAEHAEALIVIWDGHSHGSLHMLSCAKKKGLHIFEYVLHREGDLWIR